MGRWQFPYLHHNAGAGTGGNPQQAGFGRHGAGQGVEAVVGRGFGGRHQRGAALRELAVQRHCRQVRTDHGHLDHGWPDQAGTRHRRWQWLAGRALQQARGMVVALPQLGQLPVAAAGADQGDAKGQTVGPQAAGHRDGGVVQQIDKVGVGTQIAVELHRASKHLRYLVVCWRGGYQQYVHALPHVRRLLPEATQPGLGLVQVGGAVGPTLRKDAAHRFHHTLFVRIKEVPHGGVALGHQCTFVQQGSGLCQRLIGNRHWRATEGLELFNRLPKCIPGLVVAKKIQRVRDAKTEVGGKGLRS